MKTSTGELHYYASPEETPAKMQELMNWYAVTSNDKVIHPIVIAALFHHKFVAIHPFDDGNGRLSRILMNLIVMQNGYPPVVIKMDDRQNYYALLRRVDVGDSWPFVEYISELLRNSLHLYLKAAKGGSVEEDKDIDKKLALYRLELQTKVTPKKKVTKLEINQTILNVLSPFIQKIAIKLKIFNEFFEDVKLTLETTPALKNIIIDHRYEINDRINSILKVNEKFESISLIINLNDFKNPDCVFSVTEEVQFVFYDDDYSIQDIGNWEINKRYGEALSTKDQNYVIEKIINDIKYWIDENFKK